MKTFLSKKKSFFCVGQAKEARPEDITCLRTDAPAAQALEKIKEIWDNPPENPALH